MERFVFLYPEQDIFDAEIERGMYLLPHDIDHATMKRWQDASAEERKKIRAESANVIRKTFQETYARTLNRCIDERYRRRGFHISYLLYEGSAVSPIVSMHPSDTVLSVGLDATTHRKEQPDGTFQYPDPDRMIDALGETTLLRVAGFHMWDCVERFAKRAYERGIDTLVDEDLTEFLTHRMLSEGFRTDTYPTYTPCKNKGSFEVFMDARRGRPWLWQTY